MNPFLIVGISASIISASAETVATLTTAAEAGQAEAQYNLGYRYEYPSWEHTPNGDRLPPRNMPEALRWYRRSAQQSWPDGQFALGLCYIAGKGVEQDESYGLELVRKAADQHHLAATLELARLYSRGVGQPRDETDRPIALLERILKANFKGNYTETAQDTFEGLIVRFEYGIGTERDVVVAVEWHCRAALAGVSRFQLAKTPLAQSPLGNFTEDSECPKISVAIPDGLGRSEAFVSMLAHYLKAARGDEASALLIGNRYLLGQDIAQSPTKAWLWFTFAARHGSATATESLTRCESSMTSAQLAAAKSRLAQFLELLEAVSRAE